MWRLAAVTTNDFLFCQVCRQQQKITISVIDGNKFQDTPDHSDTQLNNTNALENQDSKAIIMKHVELFSCAIHGTRRVLIIHNSSLASPCPDMMTRWDSVMRVNFSCWRWSQIVMVWPCLPSSCPPTHPQRPAHACRGGKPAPPLPPWWC